MKIISQSHVAKADLTAGQFNNCEHTYLELDPGQYQTISVKLPSGQFVTLAFVPKYVGAEKSAEFECMDIHTTAGKQYTKSGDRPAYRQALIGFGDGRDTFDTRALEKKHGRPTGLATLLLSAEHNA